MNVCRKSKHAKTEKKSVYDAKIVRRLGESAGSGGGDLSDEEGGQRLVLHNHLGSTVPAAVVPPAVLPQVPHPPVLPSLVPHYSQPAVVAGTECRRYQGHERGIDDWLSRGPWFTCAACGGPGCCGPAARERWWSLKRTVVHRGWLWGDPGILRDV